MAEIHVQAKKHSSNTAWIWIIVALLIIGAIVYYLMTRNNQVQTTPAVQTDAASQLEPQAYPQPIRTKKVQVVYLRTV